MFYSLPLTERTPRKYADAGKRHLMLQHSSDNVEWTEDRLKIISGNREIVLLCLLGVRFQKASLANIVRKFRHSSMV